jgi:hypothetical protein
MSFVLFIATATVPPELNQPGVLKFLKGAEFRPASSQPASQTSTPPWAGEFNRKLGIAAKNITPLKDFPQFEFDLVVDESGRIADAASETHKLSSDWLSALRSAEPYPDTGRKAVVATFSSARNRVSNVFVVPTDGGAPLDTKALQWKLATVLEILCATDEKMTARFAVSVDDGGHIEKLVPETQGDVVNCVRAAMIDARFPMSFARRRFTLALEIARVPTEVSLRLKSVAVTGSLDPLLIRDEIQVHRGELRSCFESRLTVRKELSGLILTRFVIDADGKVSAAEVTNTTMRDARVEDCIISTIGTMSFPKPNGGGIVIVNYPFAFKPLASGANAEKQSGK